MRQPSRNIFTVGSVLVISITTKGRHLQKPDLLTKMISSLSEYGFSLIINFYFNEKSVYLIGKHIRHGTHN